MKSKLNIDTVGTGVQKEKFEKSDFVPTHISSKGVVCKPMTRGEHSISKGFPKVLNGKPEDKGYQIIYDTGYESWCPAEVFEADYRENGKLSFGQAVDFGLKKGFAIRRKKWFEKSFLYKQVNSNIPVNIIPKMSSVTKEVKKLLNRSNTELKFRDQIILVYINNHATYYQFTGDDIFSEDWFIIF